MNPRRTHRWWLLPAGLALAASVEAALVVGGFAYSKRIETRLLAEPQPLAKVTGHILGYAKKLSIAEAHGAWLRVGDGENKGWVFAGSVAEAPPERVKGLDDVPLDASSTTATAAARPLTPEAADYAKRRNLAGAGNDLDWMLKQCTALTDQEIEDYLKKNQKGEYQ